MLLCFPSLVPASEFESVRLARYREFFLSPLLEGEEVAPARPVFPFSPLPLNHPFLGISRCFHLMLLFFLPPPVPFFFCPKSLLEIHVSSLFAPLSLASGPLSLKTFVKRFSVLLGLPSLGDFLPVVVFIYSSYFSFFLQLSCLTFFLTLPSSLSSVLKTLMERESDVLHVPSPFPAFSTRHFE